MMLKKLIAIVVASIVMLLSVAGCTYGTVYGNRLSRADTNFIVKGKTTRSEIETRLGPPGNVLPIGEGRYILNYSYRSYQSTPTATSYIPVVGAFAGGADSSAETQILQIRLSRGNVVEDFTFEESINNLETRMHGTSTVTKPVRR